MGLKWSLFKVFMIMNFKHRFSAWLVILFGVLSLLPLWLTGQNVKFQAAAPKVVSVGERFRLIYSVNAVGDNFRPGTIKGFGVLSGPSQSTSQSMRMINGKTERSIEISYSYILEAQQEGNFTIEPASITVEGQQYTSNPVQIEVVVGQTPSAKNNQGQSRQNRQPRTQNRGGSTEISKDDLFVRLLVSKGEVMQGEPIVATLKLFTRVSLANLGNYKAPSYNGFWSESLRDAQNISLQRENINGVIYNTAVIEQHVLIPERSGTLTIDQSELSAVVQVRVQNARSRSLFDQFFGATQNIEKVLVSAPVNIKVNALPTGAPAGYAGAVGDIRLDARLEPTETKANEPITLKLTYSGTGNLKLIPDPKPKFPTDFEVYDPKVSNNYRATAKGFTGSKTYEYLIIPRHEGTYEIPPISFASYDLVNKEYKVSNSTPFTVDVEKGEGGGMVAVDPIVGKEEVQLLGEDIRYLKTGSIELRNKNLPFFGSARFYLGYLIPSLFLGLGLIVARNYRKRNEDVVYVKGKKAKKVAQNRLKKAKSLMDSGQKDPFYKEVINAQWGYLSDRLNIPKGELNKDKVQSGLTSKQVNARLIQDYIGFINQCEFAQFAPGKSENELVEIYNRAADLINKLERAIKN